jgi:hypothetical protein
MAAADQVGNAAHDFAEHADETKLTAIDFMLPKREQYKN